MSVLTDIAGRFTSTEQSIAVGGGGLQQLCGANPARYAVGFSVALVGGNIITSEPDDPLSGFTSGSGTSIAWFDVKTHASFPQKAWFIRNNGGAIIVTVYQVIDNNG